MTANESAIPFLSEPTSSSFASAASNLEGEMQTSGGPARKPRSQSPAATLHVHSGATTLNMPNTSNEYISTLDEPVSVTIMRDLKAVGYKLGHVFVPQKSNLLLKDWDLWGPLTLSVILSVALQGKCKFTSWLFQVVLVDRFIFMNSL